MDKLLGIDVGSTTVKTAVIDADTAKVSYSSYQRHFSRVKECIVAELTKIAQKFPKQTFKVAITGSAGLGIAESAGLYFTQEVQSAFMAVANFIPTPTLLWNWAVRTPKLSF